MVLLYMGMEWWRSCQLPGNLSRIGERLPVQVLQSPQQRGNQHSCLCYTGSPLALLSLSVHYSTLCTVDTSLTFNHLSPHNLPSSLLQLLSPSPPSLLPRVLFVTSVPSWRDGWQSMPTNSAKQPLHKLWTQCSIRNIIIIIYVHICSHTELCMMSLSFNSSKPCV